MTDQNHAPDSPEPADPDALYIAPLDEFDGEYGLDEPPKWPKAIGIISIVLGSLNFTCAGFGVAATLFYAHMMQSAQSQMKGGFPPVLLHPSPVLLAATAIGLAWAIVLIVSGALTIGRKSAGRWLHLLWSVGAIVLFVWSLSLQLSIQKEMADWVAQHPNSDFAKATQAGGAKIGLIVGIAFGAIWSLGWPLVCLIWFGVVKTKPDDMTGGVAPAAA